MTLEETKNEPLTNDFVCVDIRWALKEKDQALDNLDNPWTLCQHDYVHTKKQANHAK